VAISIEKGVPIPDGRYTNGGREKYPFRRMEIGDSFFVSDEGRMSGQWLRAKLYTYAASVRKRGVPDLRITARVVEENGVSGVRVWRVEDNWQGGDGDKREPMWRAELHRQK
jgi:hypothetical protein